VTHLPRLHAKVYVADESRAVVTSANLTDGGLFFNYELGIRVADPETARQIREDAEGYASLGADVPLAELIGLDETARALQQLCGQADKEISPPLGSRSGSATSAGGISSSITTISLATSTTFWRRSPLQTQSTRVMPASYSPSRGCARRDFLWSCIVRFQMEMAS